MSDRQAWTLRGALGKLQHPVHVAHHSQSSIGVLLANVVTGGMGSWRFVIVQSVAVMIWVTLNVAGWSSHWDIYPFILLNLMFSVQAAYASPLILMAGNVAAAKDRDLWEHDYEINQAAYAKLEEAIAQNLAILESLQQNTDLTEAIQKLTQAVHDSVVHAQEIPA